MGESDPDQGKGSDIRRFPTASSSDLSFGVLAAFAVATPPKSGPFCASGCLSYLYDDASSCVPRDFLWMYPAVLLSLGFVAFLVAVHRSAPTVTRSFTLLGLALGCIAAAVLAVDYFAQLVVVQRACWLARPSV